MKDLLIDNDCASKHFATPVLDEYRELIRWIMKFNNDADDCVLVVSQKLLAEYYRSSSNAESLTAIPQLLNLLTKQGRLIKISNSVLKETEKKLFTKKNLRSISCNKEDFPHIIAVALSNRKLAISEDEKLRQSINNFPKLNMQAFKRPSDFDYK